MHRPSFRAFPPFRTALYACAAALLTACLSPSAATASEAAPSREQLLAQARHKRDAQQWQAALHDFQQGQARFPHEPGFLYGEIYVLADGGQAGAAYEKATQLLERHPHDVDTLLVMAYTSLRQHGPFAALEYADRAQQLAPDRPYVAREYLQALRRADMPNAALEWVEKHPNFLPPAEMRVLQADAVAEIVRLSDVDSRSEAERFQLADEALAQYQRLFPQWLQAGPEAQALVQRARTDRLQALHARFYMSELVREYEDLVASQAEIPPYALADIASAYLYLRQPEKSLAIYQQLIDANYMRNDDIIRQKQDFGLLYSYSDAGDVSTAQNTASPMPQDFSPWRYVEGEKSKVPNASYLDAVHASTMMDFYANDTVGAQSRLGGMVAGAPVNNHLRTDLAWIYRSRGWPRRSEAELKVAETYEPRDMVVQLGQGNTALSLQEWRQAEAINQDTYQRYPEDVRAQRLNRLWEVHKLSELRISAYRGLSKQNPVYGSRYFGLETVVYTPPIDYNWRLFAGAAHLTGNYEDGKAQYNFERAGVEWRSRNWTSEAEVSSNRYGFGQRPGARISSTYNINDQWGISGAANWRSRAPPLDALRQNISSNSAEISLRWRQSERREWDISITPSRFSDGNQRIDVLLSGKERLLTFPRWFLDLGIEGYATRNKLNNVNYYSPQREYGVLPFLNWNHTIYQRYETAWRQNASIGFGGLYQKGFGNYATQMLSYGQRYQHNSVFELGGTISLNRRAYDSIYEREWRLVLDMIYRF
ncbi:poly-beta-1,6 N-acetyl-D-glucosamine export porin PgaA [Comamonas sp. GB3 AK4-5]|uniref:poly-beta-1,6 N-acetyl-D-glucosamine export porin PgaA n=1 Tax=Comamonas sp. GB3 AK4-5 TaxID=3231487 RepID=UPI00351E8FA1